MKICTSLLIALGLLVLAATGCHAQSSGGYYRGQSPSLTDLSIADLVMMIGNNLPTTLIIGFGLYKVWEKVSATLALFEAVSQGRQLPPPSSSSSSNAQLAGRERALVKAVVDDVLLAAGFKPVA